MSDGDSEPLNVLQKTALPTCKANSCLCVFMCLRQLTDVLNVLWQYGHMKGLKSLCVLMCRFKLPFVENILPH